MTALNPVTGLRTLLLAAALAWAAPAAAGEAIQGDGFQLRLEGDWKRAPSADPGQLVLESKALDVHLSVSSLLLKEGAQPTEKLARQLKDVRLEAERQLAEEAQLRLTLGPATVTAMKGGHRVDYAGHDQEHRRFRFRALVLPRKVLSLYVESYTRSDRELAELVEQLVQRLVY